MASYPVSEWMISAWDEMSSVRHEKECDAKKLQVKTGLLFVDIVKKNGSHCPLQQWLKSTPLVDRIPKHKINV